MEHTTRLKRILFRSNHRGTKESDLVLGPYAEAHLHTMDEAGLTEFETFLEESDTDIWDWISGAGEPEGGRYGALIETLRVVNRKKP